jgi:hypothetical protein
LRIKYGLPSNQDDSMLMEQLILRNISLITLRLNALLPRRQRICILQNIGLQNATTNMKHAASLEHWSCQNALFMLVLARKTQFI